MSDLTITLIQTSLHWESPDRNREQFEKIIQSIHKPSDLIVLPEMFSTGFSMNAAKLAEPMNGKTMEWMHRMAESNKSTITGSFIITEDYKYFNRLIWMHPNGSYSHYDKRHLFRLAEEERTYEAGKHQWIMPLKGWNIFPLICYDLRFPVWSRRSKQLDYDLLLYVANWPERRNKAWNQLLIARAIENQSYVAGVNRVGNDGNQVTHSGESAVIDFKGELISSFKAHEEKHETLSLNKQDLINFRTQFPFDRDADSFEIN